MTPDEQQFQRTAEAALADWLERLEDQAGDAFEIDCLNGILTIEMADGGVYMVNIHAPMRQIWLSSPLSGASHFEYRDGRWRSTRNGDDLAELLAAELSRLGGLTLNLT